MFGIGAHSCGRFYRAGGLALHPCGRTRRYTHALPEASQPESRRVTALVFIATAAYLMTVRTWGISQTFFLLRDQIRDWRIALRPLAELPLTGTPSTAGGASLGPVYYWVLWLSRHLIGPFTDDLPHAGAIGIALLQTGADLLLLQALYKRLGSLWLALATVLLVGTTSHDLAITATIWNPAVSVAFAKIALALLLLADERRSFWWMALTTTAVWLAVQAHSSAIFVAVPLLAFWVMRDIYHRRLLCAFQRARAIAEIVLVLQLPFLYHALTQASDAAPTRAIGGAAQAISHPETLRIGASATALVWATGRIFVMPWTTGWWWTALLVVCTAGVVARGWFGLRPGGIDPFSRGRRSSDDTSSPSADAPSASATEGRGHGRSWAVVCATVVPLLLAIVGFALWRGNYDEYWYLPLAPCVGIMIAATLSLWPRRELALAFLALVVLSQPSRLTRAHQLYRMPEYKALARGAHVIRRQTPEVRRLYTSFPMPNFSDAAFLYEVLGGRLSPDAEFDATIDETGHVSFVPVPR